MRYYAQLARFEITRFFYRFPKKHHLERMGKMAALSRQPFESDFEYFRRIRLVALFATSKIGNLHNRIDTLSAWENEARK